ncbi:MAG: MBL fold metallo-hydrolase [Cyclobacteriaceae bacterium]
MRLLPVLIVLVACGQAREPQLQNADQSIESPSLIILGTVQDAGSPQAGCTKACCSKLFTHPDPSRMVVSLGIADPESGKRWLIEATPDFPQQLNILNKYTGNLYSPPDGIFLTHAHMGHYTGLMYLGREAMNAGNIPVHVMPRMKKYLENNGPWSQLVALNNIRLSEINANEKISLTPALHITPLPVPHRDEFSETVGYLIEGPTKKALFIPDIDKWDTWDQSIADHIAKVDYALVDATFYDAEEIQNRNIREIPHPFVAESMALLDNLPAAEKKKVYFIHLNHTNPLLDKETQAWKTVTGKGYCVATTYAVLPL